MALVTYQEEVVIRLDENSSLKVDTFIGRISNCVPCTENSKVLGETLKEITRYLKKNNEITFFMGDEGSPVSSSISDRIDLALLIIFLAHNSVPEGFKIFKTNLKIERKEKGKTKFIVFILSYFRTRDKFYINRRTI